MLGVSLIAIHAASAAGQETRAATLPGAEPDTLMDLATVIARALRASPSVTATSEGVLTAESATRVARGAYLPNLTATASSLRSDIVSGTSSLGSLDNSFGAGVSSSLELFTAGRRGAERQRTEADLLAARAVNVSQRYAITLQATRAFYEALRGKDLTGVAEARVARAERGLRYAQDRVRAGTATKSDELRAQLELTISRQQRLAAQDTLQSATLVLGRVVGANGPVGARAPASLEPTALALDDSAIVALAVAQAPSVTAAEASARATDAAVRAAKSLYAPDIRLTGGYAWANQSAVVGATRPGWQVAIGTSFPIFNGYLREDAVARADAASEISHVTSADATRFVRSETLRLLNALRLSAENIKLATEAQAAAQEDLRVQTQRYRAGISTALDQLTSELAVTQAELALIAAKYNHLIARATLEAIVGRSL